MRFAIILLFLVDLSFAQNEDQLAGRKDYAILFGTDEYDELDFLSNPVYDATAIAEELEEGYGFEVELILNPTLQIMDEKLASLYDRNYNQYDQLFIFVAGHGYYSESAKKGFLATKDSKLNDSNGQTYLSYSKIRDLVDGIPSEHIMIVLDTGFGGTFNQDTPVRAGSRGQDNSKKMLPKSSYIEKKLTFRTRIYLTSGGKEYVKDGRSGRHSPFARQFLQALRERGGSDGILTKSELKGYIEVLAQMPMMGDFGSFEPGSDFIFISN